MPSAAIINAASLVTGVAVGATSAVTYSQNGKKLYFELIHCCVFGDFGV